MWASRVTGSQFEEVGVFGIDPDLHYPSIAGIDMSGSVMFLGQTNIPESLTGGAAVVALQKALEQEGLNNLRHIASRRFLLIEDQDTRLGGRNARSLILLGKSAALAHSTYARALEPDYIAYVPPQRWIGSVTKSINQERIVRRLDFSALRSGNSLKIQWPTPFEWINKVSRKNQSHIIDAIGLALWGRDNYVKFGSPFPLSDFCR